MGRSPNEEEPYIQAAGYPMYKLELMNRSLHKDKAGVRAAVSEAGGLSLLQPGRPNPELNVRMDPGQFTEAAGGWDKIGPMERFLESGADRSPCTRRWQGKTDPITHFQREGVVFPRKNWSGKKKVVSRVASQSWTWAQDPKVRESMGLVDDPDIKKQVFLRDISGNLHYCMAGGEDMGGFAGKEYLKCERPPPQHHIKANDKYYFPYCWRENDEFKRKTINHSASDRIWDVMRDEPYMKILSGESIEGRKERRIKPGLRKYKRDEAEEFERSAYSEDESVDPRTTEKRRRQRNLRSSKSLPPERFVNDDEYEEEAIRPEIPPPLDLASSRNSLASEGYTATPSMSPGSVDRSFPLKRSMTARASSNRDAPPSESAPDVRITAPPSVDPRAALRGLPPQNMRRPPSDTRSLTSRSSRSSLSMTPISIKNADFSRRPDSTSKNSDRRMNKIASRS